MRYNNIISFFALAFSLACVNKEEKKLIEFSEFKVHHLKIQEDSIAMHPNEGLVYYKDQPFTGSSIAHYPNGSVASITSYNQGIKNGLKQLFYANAQPSYESNYKNGKRNGISKTWWANGNLRTESHFIKDIPNGIQKQWYQSGSKFKFLNFKNGHEEGLQQSWRENGKLYNNYEAKNGRIFGLKRSTLCYELKNEEVQFKK